jgi:hypothetical protein
MYKHKHNMSISISKTNVHKHKHNLRTQAKAQLMYISITTTYVHSYALKTDYKISASPTLKFAQIFGHTDNNESIHKTNIVKLWIDAYNMRHK